MNTITTQDRTQIYYKDLGAGRPLAFSQARPSVQIAGGADAVLAANGYRCVAHDRRGHRRSSPPWNGNEMDTLPMISRNLSKRWA